MAQDPRRLPVLFLSDVVLLPGMVVPVELDEAARAAIDAAARGSDAPCSSRPGSTTATRRTASWRPSSASAASARRARRRPARRAARPHRQRHDRPRRRAVGRRRARSTTSPSPTTSASWPRTTSGSSWRVLQRREAWQVVDTVQPDDRPVGDRRHRRLGAVPLRRAQARAARDPRRRAAPRAVVAGRGSTSPRPRSPTRSASDVREGMEKSQREYLLRQQLAAIRKELGEGEPEGADDYRTRVEAAEPARRRPRAALKREVDKLERASDQNPETAWIRTWLDTVLELPWGTRTDDSPTSSPPVRSSTPTTTASTRSRTASSSTSPCARVAPSAGCRSSADAAPAPSCCSPDLPASARPRSASPWPAPSVASSSASPWAACATRPRSAATAAPTSARCPAASCAPSRRPAR